MKLIVKDRLVLQASLQKEGDFLMMNVIKEIKEKVKFSEKEQEKIGMKVTPGGNIGWDDKKETPFSIEFTSIEFDVITDCLKELDKTKKLTEEHIDLYRKFVHSDKEEEKVDAGKD
jgi:hypothetical protein